MTRLEAYEKGLAVGHKIWLWGEVYSIHCMFDNHTILTHPRLGKCIFSQNYIFTWPDFNYVAG